MDTNLPPQEAGIRRVKAGSCCVAALVALATVCATSPASAQTAPALVVSGGAGATYYCIVSRCDSGTTVGLAAELGLTRALGVHASVRRHFCFDCDRFVIGDAALVLQYPARTVSPFAAVGVTFSSAPDFMGNQTGLLAAGGASIRLTRRWSIRPELRGRTIGSSDRLVELAVSVAHRSGRSAN